jgi:DNA-binding NarL/FixJ family response regulator
VKIRVFITDDHVVVRKGLRGILEECEDIEVVGEAPDYAGLVAGLSDKQVDVLVIDVAMPGKNGIDALKQLVGERPGLKALVVSMYPEDQFALRALKAGASGYLTKTSGPDRLVDAVRTIAAGRKFVTPEVAQALANNVGGNAEALPHSALSDREFQTLRLIAAGKKPAVIAKELAISVKTVSVYRARLLEKLKMKSTAELTRYAVEHKLLD